MTPLPETRVHLYQDADGSFHYVTQIVGQTKSNTTLCGLPYAAMRTTAWFGPPDERGRLHYHRACPTCREGLTI